MRFFKFDANKCTLCRECMNKCPFGAISMEADGIKVGETCKMCGVCVKTCPTGAIAFEQKAGSADKSKWRDILVYGEVENGRIHPVVFELIGEARKLAAKVNYKVKVVMVGAGAVAQLAEELPEYGVDEIFVYDHPGFDGFKVDCYTDAVADCIAQISPSVVLIGATPLGRSLAPRLATRFHTGLTADCTILDIKDNTDMVQTRPAFGGNIMAQILIADARPQFATVRYKVMDKAERVENPTGKVTLCKVTDDMARSRIEVIEQKVIEHEKTIEEEEILLVAGRGVSKESDIEKLKSLAQKLGGQLCYTRPLVESGFGDTAHQIGLSGRTVKPKLIITFGVSGAIQFTAGMNGADCIIAINNDPNALIFNVADYCIVEDASLMIPEIEELLKMEGGAK